MAEGDMEQAWTQERSGEPRREQGDTREYQPRGGSLEAIHAAYIQGLKALLDDAQAGDSETTQLVQSHGEILNKAANWLGQRLHDPGADEEQSIFSFLDDRQTELGQRRGEAAALRTLGEEVDGLDTEINKEEQVQQLLTSFADHTTGRFHGGEKMEPKDALKEALRSLSVIPPHPS